MHSHILPGIDDGAKDWEEFSAMAEVAVSEGVTHMVCTPHFIPRELEFDLNAYGDIFNKATQILTSQGLQLTLIPGSEIFVSAGLAESWQQGKLLSVNKGGKYLLVEFSRLDLPGFTRELLFELKLQGVTPIIAHPERNRAFMNKPQLLVDLIEQGALCQVNTGSITGHFGEQVKKAALEFLQGGMIHMIGTDAHSPRTRAPRVQQALRVIQDLLGNEQLTELVEVNPLKVINGMELEPYPIGLYQEKKSLWGRLIGGI